MKNCSKLPLKIINNKKQLKLHFLIILNKFTLNLILAYYDHIISCDICANNKTNANSFKIIKKCNSNFETKTHEAFIIQKHNLRLNRQLFANESLFLLNVF